MGAAVVVDIDGVVADATGRQHHIRRRPKAWDAFFDAVGDDPVIESTRRLLGSLDPSLLRLLVTARPLRVQDRTVGWLERHELRWDLLVMRPDGDHRPSDVVKAEAVRELLAGGLDVRLAFEDDPRNVLMFERHGIPCVYVHSGYYEDLDPIGNSPASRSVEDD